jgi:hypothetical protein
MKPKIQPRKSHGFITKLIPMVLFVVCSSLVFNSCQKEEVTPLQAVNQLKSTALVDNDGYSIYYQNELFIRETGKPVIVNRQIGSAKLNDYEGCLRLNVQSGADGDDFVSSAVVKIDGKTVLSTSDFNNSSQSFQIDLCDLTLTSVMEVEIFGTPGSTLEIWIDGKLKYDLKKGLIAYYPFNNNYSDESGNGNNGTPYGTSFTTDRFEKPNSACYFNGHEFILIEHRIQISNSVTFSCWTKHNDLGARVIISKRNGQWGDPGNNNWQISSEIGGLLNSYLWGTNSTCMPHPPFVFIAADLWTHIVITYDGSIVKFYKDSNLVDSYPNSGNINDYDHYTRIGDDWWGNSFLGKIDDIRIYNRALGDGEISALYHEGGY